MAGRQDTRFRLIGFLPLTFFLAQTIHYWRVGGMGNLLWMCNVGNLLLAAGLFLNHRELIRAAAIWTIPGLAIWIRYVLFEYDFVVSSALAHVGGIIVALIVLRRVRMDRIAWTYAFVWYLFNDSAGSFWVVGYRSGAFVDLARAGYRGGCLSGIDFSL